MNPDYRKSRFRFTAPEGGLPDCFAVITVCNPDGVTIPQDQNAVRTTAFQSQLADCGITYFNVTGYDPESPHHEGGFGVVCDRATVVGLGRQWDQEAIFWVEHGEVLLISCIDPTEVVAMGAWASLTDP